jgi:small subunit ribosomal protein S2
MEKNGIHILDLNKTLVKIDEACAAAKQIAKSGRKILFVATKKQAKDTIAELAKSVGMPYVTERWPGGMLTNFFTIRKAVKKMTDIDKLMSSTQFDNLAKREKLQIQRERAKLEKNLGSISDLSRLPAAVFIVDILKEHIAVAEARRLNITTFAIVDTNSNPNLIDFPIPANDDASKSIHVIVQAICDAVTEGAAERKLDKESQDDDSNDDMTDMDVMIDDEEDQTATGVEVKGVKKVKDVSSDEESTTKRKRIPTKKTPVKVPGKGPAKGSAKK